MSVSFSMPYLISAILLGSLGVQANTVSNLVYETSDAWQPIDIDHLIVRAGSALDLSTIADVRRKPLVTGTSVSLPRLIIGSTGKLVAEDRPDTPIRLKGTGINYPWIAGAAKKDPDWKSTFSQQVLAAKRQGYNLIRTSADVGSLGQSFLPDNLDKTDFLAAELTRQGIYRIFDCNLYLRHAWEPGTNRMDYTLRMYLGDPIVRNAWKQGTDFMMNHVNPYTGLPWKEDSGIACVILYNEQEWGFFHPKSFLSKETQAEFDSRYRQWLQHKYATPGLLAKAWKDSTLKDFNQIVTPDNYPQDGTAPRDNDFILFCGELSRESARWMADTLRATGYTGLISQYNLSQGLEGQRTRWEVSPVSIANSYHNHPTSFDNPGSICEQDSSIGAGAWYWRNIAATRFADRPFIQTEFNHPFWNPYQHECGILYGAYSAFQGFDVLSIHENAVFQYVGKPGLSIFTVGRSPIARAGEFLSTCLFLRRDITPSPHRIELQIPQPYLESNGNGARMVSADQGKFAFVSGFSIAFAWSSPVEGVGKPRAPDLVINPVAGTAVQSAGGGWSITSTDLGKSTFSLDPVFAGMRDHGLLKKDNRSSASAGVFESDTGEIIMRTKEHLLKVVTPRTEAVSLEGLQSETLNRLQVVKTSVPALVAACAVDNNVLSASRRIVLIYATDAVNSRMELSPDRKKLINLGGLPVLLRVGKLEATLQNDQASTMKLYALGLDGSRQEELPLTAKAGVIQLSLDTRKLKKGPTPFFEIVAESNLGSRP